MWQLVPVDEGWLVIRVPTVGAVGSLWVQVWLIGIAAALLPVWLVLVIRCSSPGRVADCCARLCGCCPTRYV
jgi:hypothetical protein